MIFKSFLKYLTTKITKMHVVVTCLKCDGLMDLFNRNNYNQIFDDKLCKAPIPT